MNTRINIGHAVISALAQPATSPAFNTVTAISRKIMYGIYFGTAGGFVCGRAGTGGTVEANCIVVDVFDRLDKSGCGRLVIANEWLEYNNFLDANWQGIQQNLFHFRINNKVKNQVKRIDNKYH